MKNSRNRSLESYLENAETDEEVSDSIQKYIENNGFENLESLENIVLDNAYELLKKASETKSRSRAIKLAEEAYEICPDCFDAVLFLVEFEYNSIKKEKLLLEGLKYEKSRLKEEGFFDKECIGVFYGMFETRPYIRGLYIKAALYASNGKIKLARDTCLEILKLNESDNLGIRYLLMAIYSFLEEEDELLKISKKYKEENLSMLVPQMVLYYKKGDYSLARKFLEKINGVNKNFRKYFKGTMPDEDDLAPKDYYSVGRSSEVQMYFRNYSFLMDSVGSIKDFILENSF